MQVNDISGVILAGGLGSRLGGEDKGLVEVAGLSMVAHVLRRFRPQVGALVINANRNLARYREFGFPVITDSNSNFAGPLAGMSAALDQCSTRYLATSPCDAPFLPTDLVARLAEALEDSKADIAIALGAGRPQPAFTLMSTSIHTSLTKFLDDGGRKISYWYRQQAYVEVDFGIDSTPFANINLPEDLAAANDGSNASARTTSPES